LSFAAYILIKSKRKVGLINKTLMSFIIFSSALMILPQSTISEYLNNNQLIYTNNISFKDFKGKPNYDENFDATIFTGIRWKINRAYNYPPADINAYMFPKKSFVKMENITNPEILLNHELGHFRITEQLKVVAISKTKEYFGSTPEKIADVVLQIAELNNLIDSIYDKQTIHGIDTAKQRFWDNNTNSIVNKYVLSKLSN
jgi:hypothetical protein